MCAVSAAGGFREAFLRRHRSLPYPSCDGARRHRVPHGRLQMHIYAASTLEWHMRRRAPLAGPIVGVPNAPPALVWRSHWRLRLGTTEYCLLCGRSAAMRASGSLARTPCNGPIEVPPSTLSGPLWAGAFDEALAVAAPSWIERAIALGWRAVDRPDRGGALPPCNPTESGCSRGPTDCGGCSVAAGTKK